MKVIFQNFKKYVTFSTYHKDIRNLYFIAWTFSAGLGLVYGLHTAGGFDFLYQNPVIYIFGKVPKLGLIMLTFSSVTLLGVHLKSPKILKFVDKFIIFTQQKQINLSIVLIIWFSVNAFYLSEDFRFVFNYSYVIGPHGTFLELFAVFQLITLVLSMVFTLLYITIFNSTFKDLLLCLAIFMLSWL